MDIIIYIINEKEKLIKSIALRLSYTLSIKKHYIPEK